MGAARKIRTTVRDDGVIEVRTPDLPPGQPVEVTIRPEDGRPHTRRSLVDILADCRGGLLFKSPEEVDAAIREERDSWGR